MTDNTPRQPAQPLSYKDHIVGEAIVFMLEELVHGWEFRHGFAKTFDEVKKLYKDLSFKNKVSPHQAWDHHNLQMDRCLLEFIRSRHTCHAYHKLWAEVRYNHGDKAWQDWCYKITKFTCEQMVDIENPRVEEDMSDDIPPGHGFP